MGGLKEGLSRVDILYRAERWRECVATCKEVMERDDDASDDDWYTARATATAAAVKLEGLPDARDAVAIAIEANSQILDSPRLEPGDQWRGFAYRNLGALHGMRETEGPRESNRLAVESYESAVAILATHQDREVWADVTLELGNELLERARMVTNEEILESAHEFAWARDGVMRAISAYERALSVYREDGFAEETETAAELIVAAHEILDLLNRRERSMH